MRARTVLALAFLLVLAACGGSSTAPEVPQTTPAPNTTSATTTTIAATEGMTLRYGYEDGQQLRYSFTEDIAQNMTMEVAELSGEAGFPEAVNTSMRMEGTVAVGSTELANGNTRVEFSMEIDGVSGEITAGEERIDLSDPGLAGELTSVPLNYEMVINEQGEIVDLAVDVAGESTDLTPWLDLLGGDASGWMGEVGNEAMFGIPEFPEDAVEVGTSWEVDNSQEIFGLLIETGAVYTVTEIEGDVVTINVETSTSAFSMTSDDFIEILSAIPEDQLSEAFGSPITTEELEEVFDLLQFEMQSEPSTGIGTLQFDVEEGVTVFSSMKAEQVITMVMSIPDEATGDMIDISIRVDQSVGFELTLKGDGPV